MNYTSLLLLVIVAVLSVRAQHENIPYEDVEKICETCSCLTAQDANKRFHYTLNCATKNFHHILARWPLEFGTNHNDIDIVAIFSGNSIETLQQLPATNASLTFSCSHCGTKQLQAPTFMDVPNIRRLELSWNKLTADELTPDVFRGPYRANSYEPVALADLDLSHNELHSLNKKLFEHTPYLTKLDLSYNPLRTLDNSMLAVLVSARNLEVLDLSHTGLKTIPAAFFKTLVNLKTLNLAGNAFNMVPENLSLLGISLTALNLAGNPLARFDEHSFLGLTALKRLNVSDMPSLRSIEKGTFSRLTALEHLYCTHNQLLAEIDLDSLLQCSNLTHLDISYCALTTLHVDKDLSVFSTPEKVPNANFTAATNATVARTGDTNTTITNIPTNTTFAANGNANGTVTLPLPWPKLNIFETVGNPWHCDCVLLQTLEYAGAHHRYKTTETRCETPYLLSGARLSNITARQICAMQMAKTFHVVEDEPPRFLRKNYIILTLIIASVVIVLGLIVGFLVVCIRRRLKREDFDAEPIRYTSVRSSNLSAFSHVNTNGNSNAAAGLT